MYELIFFTKLKMHWITIITHL